MSESLIVLAVLVLGFCYLPVRRSFEKTRPEFLHISTCALRAAAPGVNTRWVVTGMMGSGKSTLAAALSELLGTPHIEIDLISPEAAIHAAIEADPNNGWVAEANPWQIPPSIWSKADIVLILDYDNTVNYLRLLSRGFKRCRSSGSTWKAFREHVVEKAIKDWCLIVYLHGNSNRAGWRKHGIGGPEVDLSSAVIITCFSPAEVRILLKYLSREIQATK